MADKSVVVEKKREEAELSLRKAFPLPELYFLMVSGFSVVSLLVFFFTLKQFGPTITGSITLMGIFLTVISIYFERITTRAKMLFRLAVVVQLLTVGTVFVANLLMFAL